MAINPSVQSDVATANVVIRQYPFSIALDAWALLVTSFLLLLGMRCLPLLFLQVVIIVIPVALLVRNDYVNFLLLGPGGTPPTFQGYARLSLYKLFLVRDVYAAPSPDRTRNPSNGILKQLPYRSGPRPKVAGLAPQRQLNQPASPECYAALRKAIESLAKSDSDSLSTGTSCVEKHGFGFFARHPVTAWGNGEICHIHDIDKSMHMNLHADDIKEVLEKGWGERHPLGFTGPIKAPCPSTFIMVYAPRGKAVATRGSRGSFANAKMV